VQHPALWRRWLIMSLQIARRLIMSLLIVR